MTEKRIILIGGAPTAGKSTLARLLSKHLGLPWISTDQIRTIMQTCVRREDMPDLLNPEGHTAESFLTQFSTAEIVEMEMRQSEATWLGIKALVEGDSTWRNGFIIEGVNILPRLVARDFGDSQHIRALFLADKNEERTRHVIFTRGLWADARTYSDDVKEKEVEWTLLFSHKLEEEAHAHHYPCIHVQKDEHDLHTVLETLEAYG